MAEKRLWLINLRKQRNMTQQEVADVARIDRSFYSQIENGDRGLSVTTAKKISSVLGFDWTIFFEQNSGESQPNSA